MMLEPVPIRTPCCKRLAMRTVMTTINLDSEHFKPVAANLRQELVCPHCGRKIARDKGQRIHGFRGPMQRYIFAGIPTVDSAVDTKHPKQGSPPGEQVGTS